MSAAEHSGIISYITLPQGEAHTPVVLGQPGDEPLLGVVTLEILGLVLNPLTRELQRMRMLLASPRPFVDIHNHESLE